MLCSRKLASAAVTACLVTMGGIGTTVLSAGAAHAATCPTASQIVTDINAVASMAASLNSQLSTLAPTSSASNVAAVAQSTTLGLNTMSNDLAADAVTLSGCPALGSADSATVADAFGDLAGPTNQMLSTLIGKHLVFAQFGVAAPISSALRSLEGSFDSEAFALLAVAPTQRDTITNAQNTVDASLGDAITVYEQLCIPSPLYPAIQPVCVAL